MSEHIVATSDLGTMIKCCRKVISDLQIKPIDYLPHDFLPTEITKTSATYRSVFKSIAMWDSLWLCICSMSVKIGKSKCISTTRWCFSYQHKVQHSPQWQNHLYTRFPEAEQVSLQSRAKHFQGAHRSTWTGWTRLHNLEQKTSTIRHISYLHKCVFVCVCQHKPEAGTWGSVPSSVRFAGESGRHGEGLRVEFTTHRTDVSNS